MAGNRGCIEGGPRASCFNLITFHSTVGGGGGGGPWWVGRYKISLIHKNSPSVSRRSFCPREIKISARGRIIDSRGTRGIPSIPTSLFLFPRTKSPAG